MASSAREREKWIAAIDAQIKSVETTPVTEVEFSFLPQVSTFRLLILVGELAAFRSFWIGHSNDQEGLSHQARQDG